MTALRSALFMLLAIIVTVAYGPFVLTALLFNHDLGYEGARSWGVQIERLVRHLCGIRYQIRGLDNLPKQPAVIMSKHQSAWETVVLLKHMPRSAWIVKRELLPLPVIGWVLLGLRSIAIDRKSGKAARDQILEQGRERIARGLWVVIFPEGTRTAPGKRGRYGIGGAWLAAHTGTPIVPVAHNAGECWRRNAFVKKPGLITLSIGPVIETVGKQPEEVIKAVEDWIEHEMEQLPSAVS